MLGSEHFYMLLIPFLFALFDRKQASYISTFILFSLLLNSIIKTIFLVPRPDHSIVDVLYFAKGYSFPSGHAQGSLTLWGIIAYHLKNDVKKIILCVFMVLWISLSRIYLCVHFPVDIIGGWFFGFIIVSFYIFAVNRTKKMPRLILLCIFIILMVCLPQPKIIKIGAVLCGIHLGMMIMPNKLDIPADRKNLIFKLFIVLLGSGLFFISFSVVVIFPWLKYAAVGMWLSFMYPYAVTKVTPLPFGIHH
ncbi:phosphatase PAP2 family protein [bacterium]|nr:phosphatase PAP2 family protein [bacterium]